MIKFIQRSLGYDKNFIIHLTWSRWTQRDLSRVTGIRPNTINDLYHEMTERVSLEELDLICEALNCQLSDLIVREANSTPKLDQTVLKTLNKKK